MHNNINQLKDFLYKEIPLASYMGIDIIEASTEKVEIHAPLDPNRNHLETAFGGSIGTILITSCYVSLFHRMLSLGFDGHVLIREAKTDYLLPVHEKLKAVCLPPSKGDFEKFLTIYERRGISKISMEATLVTSEGIAATFSGVFVAQKSKA